jgi:glycosyltransferase involved in cell wall biosynthesis
MIIGVDGNEANVKEKVGVSVYTSEMLRYFHQQASPAVQFIIYLREKPLPDLPKETPYFSYDIVRGEHFWRDIVFPFHLYKNPKIDVLFCPAHYTPRFSPVPTVVTIHDTSYIYFKDEFLKKDLYKLTSWSNHAIKNSTKVITVSNATKKDVVKNYHVASSKIKVIHNGFDKSKEAYKDVGASFSLPKSPYFLYVGTIQPRKNIRTLITAFKSLHKKNPKYKLVLVGKMGWLFGDIFDYVLEQELEDHIIFTGYVSNSQLAALYKKAECFIFPSLYEGFGIPLLEAMQHRCPVIASNAASLPEVGGDAAIYFNPKDPDELEGKIEEMINNASLRQSLVKKGLKRVQLFSWEKSARETLRTIIEAFTPTQ